MPQKKSENMKKGDISDAERERLIREVEEEILQNPTYQFYEKLLEEQTAIDAARTSALTAEDLFRVHLDAAQAGDSSAMWAVANMYLYGQGVSTDVKKSLEWRQKAAQAGDSDAMIELARRGGYFGKRHKSANDYAQAVVWYRRAAEMGRVEAMYRLAFLLGMGQGIEKDAPQAIEWLRKAAVAGHGNAMEMLAKCYRNGRGVEQNDMAALIWYQKAAAAKNSSAMYELAQLYYHGHIVARDKEKAMEWYKKAADLGHKESQNLLRELMPNTSDTPKSKRIPHERGVYCRMLKARTATSLEKVRSEMSMPPSSTENSPTPKQ